MAIQPASEDDAAALIGLARSIDLFTAQEVDVIAWILDTYLHEPDGWNYSFVAYRERGCILGFACYGPVTIARGTFELDWMGVAPARQGQGIGGQLLCHVERDVRRQGARLLVVETSSRQSYCRTRRFYEQHGYERAALIRAYYGADDDKVVYTKYFDGPAYADHSEAARSSSA
jgi:GNAT superfamily N-acetyltransferase